MGQFDAHIEDAKRMLAEAESDYSERAARADLVGSARDFVLNEAQSRIDEANGMIRTFTDAND